MLSGKGKKVVFSIITLLVVIICVIVFLEIFLRLFWGGEQRVPEEPSKNPYYPVEDGDIGYVLVPNHQYQMLKLQTNKYGFRIFPGITEEKKKGVYRVAALGDSVMFGYHTYKADTIPRILEKGLNHHQVEGVELFQVLNFAMPGYNLEQYQGVLEKYAILYKPDLILVGITFLNDFNGFTAKYLDKGYLTNIPRYDIHGYNYEINAPTWLQWNSYLLRYLYLRNSENYEDFYRASRKKGEPERVRRRLKASCDRRDEIWSDTEQIVKKIRDVALRSDSELLFILFPTLKQVIYDDVPHTPQQIFTDILKKHNLNWIDYISDFIRYFKTSGYFPFRDRASHPDNIMYELMAYSVRDRVLSKMKVETWKDFDGIIDVGHWSDYKYLSFGWGIRRKVGNRFRWVESNSARLIFDRHKEEINSIEVICKKHPLCNGQNLTLFLNGKKVGYIVLKNDDKFHKYTVKFDTSYKLNRFNTIDFRFSIAKRIKGERSSVAKTQKLFSAAVERIIIN